ncbi:MAG: TIGR04551 family protein [Deltaproteobacteria bacterium]|nr:MAG: TIGR04551 family protein [Deltaproteobacteria bacterium]
MRTGSKTLYAAVLSFCLTGLAPAEILAQQQDEKAAGDQQPRQQQQAGGDLKEAAGKAATGGDTSAQAGKKEQVVSEKPPVLPEGFSEVPEGFEAAEAPIGTAETANQPFNVLDLHGYLRLRGDLIDGGDLGLGEHPRSYSVPEDRGVAYPQFPSSPTGRHDTMAMANMRFRLEPTINISEDVRIMAQIDILDNLILGSTPNGYPQNQYYPLVVFSDGQIPPTAGFNSLRDSITVKRVWGEVMTPLGLLRFGRMPSHWGLGLLANDGGPSHYDNGPLVTQPDYLGLTGQCFDCDFGSTADRILFATKIFGHYVVPIIDFTSEGPYFSFTNEYNGQNFDLDQLDDVNSYILAVFKRDKPEDIRAKLARGDWVLNYGLYFVYRNQALDAIDYNVKNPADPASGSRVQVDDYAVRNAWATIPDIWVRFMWKKLRLELEFVSIIGKIGYTNVAHNLDSDGNLIAELAEGSIDLLQFGFVLQGDYKFLDDKLIVGLEVGFASGDDSPGMGVRPFAEKQYSYEHGDTNINNFRFNLDYHVDMILWREIIGTVTDAFYLKPSVRYDVAEGFGAKLSMIYSGAVYPDSTRGKSSPLGIEFDLDFFYFSDDNFHAGLSYGLLVPLSGMTYLGADMAPGGIGEANQDDAANVAHRLLGRLVLYF